MTPFPFRFDRSLTPRSWQGILVATSLLMGTSGCQSVLLTTRLQPLDPWPRTQEVELGAKVYQDILASEPKSQNAQLSQMLDRVGQRLAAASQRPDFQWEFTLLSGPRQEAFCLPGGKVLVYEGLLPVCANEAGLAVVLSHEIAHVLSQHGSQRMAQQIRAEEGAPAFGRLVIGRDSKRIEMMKQVYGLGTSQESHVPFSRTQENEADSIGLLLMARAGYDPQEALRFWDRSQQMAGSPAPDLLAKHPHEEARTAQLMEIVQRALSVYHSAPQRHGLGEPFPQEALAAVDRPLATPAVETAATATPDEFALATAAAPPSSLAAVTIAPAPIMQIAPTAMPASTSPPANDGVSWTDFGAPTVEGPLVAPPASPIVTASLEVIVPPDTTAAPVVPVSNSIQDMFEEEVSPPAFPSAEALAEETTSPQPGASGTWKPHQE